MNEPPEDVKRWTARSKAAAVVDILKGKTTTTELARSHDLTLAEVEGLQIARDYLGKSQPDANS